MASKEHREIERPPVVVVMGHVDHGKSTLLDFIRKSNIVAKEAGGITQHLGAYEVTHKWNNTEKRITFIDTPGHEAFKNMRTRGAEIADIAILIVSAEDGVKAQTKEALSTILESKTPYVVAINKIDKPGANVEKTKNELMESGVYLEGYGGNISFAEISAKSGTGVDSLFDIILLTAELEELKGDPDTQAEGVVIETERDPKRGISAVMVIKNGTMKKGDIVVSGEASSSTRMLEDTTGKSIKEASFSTPVRITGFDKEPVVGSRFITCSSKKDAEACVLKHIESETKDIKNQNETSGAQIPLIIKTDVAGTGEAIVHEIKKINKEEISYKIILLGTGTINEADLKLAGAGENAVIVGFNTKIDPRIKDIAEKQGISISVFDVIYKLTEYLGEELEKRRPRQEVLETTGKVKILKQFNRSKDKQVLGARVTEGKITDNATVKILRRDNELGYGKIVGLEILRAKTKEVTEENEFGMMLESKIDVEPGDILESFITKTI